MKSLINVVSIVGPTASGKTRLSVDLAKKYNGEIVSADSMQIYKGMDIATAKPSEEEKKGIAHHLMDCIPPEQAYSVAHFVSDASKVIQDIHSRGKLPFIVGGTGLFVDSLLNGIKFSEEPRDDNYSAELWKIYYEEGIEPLLKTLGEIDPEAYCRLNSQRNPKRIIRAIEFYKSTGETITSQLEKSKRESPYKAVKLGINFKDREKLYDRINKRVDLMIENGLLDEAKKYLGANLSYTSSMAIGYKELKPYFNNEKTLSECVEKLKRETRRYAKRQITWFKRDTQINWLYADDYCSYEELKAEAENILNKEAIYG